MGTVIKMMLPPLDVVVVGAIGVDPNVFLGKEEIDFEVEANFSQNLDYVGGAGGYGCRYFDGYSPDDAILRGQLVARYTCTQKASSSNLITHEQLDAFYAQKKSGEIK